ncbi:MalY/PatB family protein [Enterococcus bulliens]
MDSQTFIETYYQERQNSDSLKWDALVERFGDKDLLPLWVADSDFSTDSQIKQALVERIEHGIFGYSTTPKDYVDAYQGWLDRHEKTQVEARWLTFSTGVVQSLYDLIACFTQEEDAVLIQPPVYYPFYNAINDQKRQLIEAPLKNEAEHYTIDFEQLESIFANQEIKLFIFCSPHNPVGRVWTKDEVTRVMSLCQQYGVFLISDEIHSDLVLIDRPFVSALTIAKEIGFTQLAVCNAPSKTFNFAGLLNSHIWIIDEDVRQRFFDWSKVHRQTELSVLGQVAAKTAYAKSDEWLASFLSVVKINEQYIRQTLRASYPDIEIAPLEGTYLLWIDLAKVSHGEVKTLVQDKAKLAIDFGEWFSKDYATYIRINLATKPEIIQKAVTQLIYAIDKEANI